MNQTFMKKILKTPSTTVFGCLCLISLLAATYEVNAGLTHEYSFNDAVSSTNATDSVGGATGDLYPGASYPGDGTVLLDGASGFVYLPDDIISNYTSVAFEIWTTPTSTPTWARLFDFGINQGGRGTGGAGGTGGNGITWTYVCFSDGGGTLRGDMASATSGENIIYGPRPTSGESHDIVFTVDATAKTAALYDNGAQVSFMTNFTLTPTAVGHTFNDYIGRSQWPDAYYVGSIDEFRIYDSPLTPAQVEADFEAGPGSTSASSGALNSIRLGISTNLLLGAIVTPNLSGNYASLTNSVNLTSLAGIVYASDNPSIVSLGADGNFHAAGLGNATLHATYQSKSSAVTVTVAAEPVVLQHRYSFSEAAGTTTINDSVGNATGTLVNPSGTSTLTGSGQLVLDGNASSAYVSLPPGMTATLTNATFQVWLDWFGGGNWQQIYSLGTNFNGAGVAYTTLIPQNGANGHLRWSINEAGETVVDAPFTLAISNQVCVTVVYNYSAQTASLFVGARKVGSSPMNKALYTIPDGDNYIGKSQFAADPYLQGILDEFRIYSGVKSDLQVAIDAVTGPDTTITDPGALTSISVTTSNTVDVHGASSPIQVSANFAKVSGVDIATLPQTVITSSDPSVATIVNGDVVPQNVGATTITATYGNTSGSILVTVVDTNSWPTLLHRYTFNDAPASTTIADSVGGINGTLHGVYTLNGSQLVMPNGNPPPGSDGQPTAASGWVSFPAGQGMITSLPNEASFEIWVVWNGGAVWQEMFDFGQAANPGVSTGGGQYVMISPHDGASGSLRAEWDQNPTYDVTLTGPSLQVGVLSQVVYSHDQDRQLDRLYLNGQQVATAQNTGLWSTFPDTDNWMARDERPDAMFNGAYSDFRIWNGALTAGQVANLYAAGPNVIAGPALKITVSGGQATLKWAANAAGYTLQSSTTLASGNWVTVPGTPTVTAGVNSLTVSGSQAAVFYRLKQ
jgi:hypothetical protein